MCSRLLSAVRKIPFNGHGVCIDAFGVLAGTEIGSNIVVGAIYAVQKPSSSDPHADFQSSILQVPGQYAHMQDAIEAAVDGDTIIVEPGTYKENLDFLGKKVVLRSSQPDNPEIVATTIIEAMNGPTVLFAPSESSLAVLKGFTLRNDQGEFVIKIASANPTIYGNIIRDSSSGAIAVTIQMKRGSSAILLKITRLPAGDNQLFPCFSCNRK